MGTYTIISSLTINSQQLRDIDAGLNIISKEIKGPKQSHTYAVTWFTTKTPLQFSEK